ncbi:4-alpha-glucanotransferase [Schaalia suimastitidis]|uniref:4-alpha-glucanotransferase n=1 Tax=Schaalia suimastitidis TaxID=121163 RepID=UPI0003FEF7C2|nr:4-alpha-glucanotransferase [Schaalia suimastitidis]
MALNAPAGDDIELLRNLAQRNGVATGFWDWYGQRKDVSADSLLRVLQSLGLPVDPSSTVADVHVAMNETENNIWRATLPPTVVLREGADTEINVHVPDGEWVSVEWITENGNRGYCDQRDNWDPPRVVDGILMGRATFHIPSHLGLGWHRLEAHTQGGHHAHATLIVVPNALTVPTKDGKRRWGMAAQLYSTRSRTSWGMGDAADLADLLAVSAEAGADFLLMNPVHASAPIAPIENSPYLPVTRRWVNPIYIRPERIDEYGAAPESVRRYVDALRERTAWHDGDLIDRDRTWAAKCAALELIFPLPRSVGRQAQYVHFVRRGGADLENFALWCAIVEREGTIQLPDELADVNAPAVAQARHDLAERIEFWRWCQWIAADQLAHAQYVSRRLGMDVGVMADLAVGVHPYGSEKWSDPAMFAPRISVGAPPDMYAQQGQDWSQPPWSPRALAEAGYRPLREMMRATLANAGAVRIDHILGLFRLWWIPEGQGAGAGTYVSYDHEAMVGVILLEAQRAGAQVIGEDLGTVEPWVRGYLHDRGILGTSVLWFEKEGSGWPLHADQYRDACLAAVTTHDLPPTAGYLVGVQTTLRDQLGLLVDDVKIMRDADEREQSQMRTRLHEYGLLEEGECCTQEHVEALHAYVARTPAQLVVASLVDAVGDTRPQNLPGTNREYPNWCVPLCDGDGHEVLIEALPTNSALASLASVLNREMLPQER